jgi:putative NIF3 family GTP cyclohydrolase 1 type 2
VVPGHVLRKNCTVAAAVAAAARHADAAATAAANAVVKHQPGIIRAEDRGPCSDRLLLLLIGAAALQER